MSSIAIRIKTLQTIIVGHRDVGVLPDVPAVVSEFEAVNTASKLSNSVQRYLLQVVHGSRAVDTGLSIYARFLGAKRNESHSIGKSLGYLHTNGYLQESDKDQYQKTVADVRNRYLHRAGVNPAGVADVADYLRDMEACLAKVLGRPRPSSAIGGAKKKGRK